ncbi:RRP15-like protein [Stegodyphus dumicola]|uniref:RRP15-like protein n=1 Tax=Stegodyphus dumicola TaxID=202533 RepID=UPI0015A75FC7|nr:RRP15-like protein [Stegodyphus dumicola]XP_035211316.1 RRP15-like protein [Stegodyphus dumicola]
MSSVSVEEDESEMDFSTDSANSIAESDSADDEDDEISGNAAWADALSKVLNCKISKEKNFILSKAKKDSEIKPKDATQVEIVDESGKLIKEDKNPDEYSQKRKAMLDKQKQKALWESMCRVKPDVTDKEKERELMRIATRGVVHLFNSVKQHRKVLNSSKLQEKKKPKINVIKGNFMDILKGHSKPTEKKVQEEGALQKTKREETWSVLKDDFMMGAEMKDWDKENSDDDK